MNKRLAVPCAVALLCLSGTALSQPLGSAFTYQGQLMESGQPAAGLFDLQVCLFDSPSNPVPIGCAPDFNDVPVEAGVFTISLDFGSSPFAGQQRFIELRVRPGVSTGVYTILGPRQLLRPTPEALRSNVASAAPWSGLTGVPAGFADGIDNDSGGTVTSLTAGTGLNGGTITGSGTIGIANGGVGLAQINTAQVQARVSAGCAIGQYLRSVNTDGTVVCGTDATGGSGTVTSVTAGTGLTGGTIIASGTVGIANGGVGLAQINPEQVQARIAGTCPVGEYLRGIHANGSVICEPVPGVLRISTVDRPPNFTGQLGQYTAIAIGNDGLPVISYFDLDAGALKVAKCATAACTGAAIVNTVDDPTNIVGQYTDIAIGHDGMPVISYFDVTDENLKVAKCATANCSVITAIATLDDSPFAVGRTTSIAVNGSGIPVISYFDGGALTLKVAACANSSCEGPPTITTISPPGSFEGLFSSIAIGDDGLPVISYFDAQRSSLNVAKCADSFCSGAATITTVDDPANSVGEHTSIAIGSDGAPIISYHDGTARALKVAKCTNAACTGTATISTIDDPANEVGTYSSIAIGSDRLPVISYFDSTGGALKVAKCVDPACSEPAMITTFSDSPNVIGLFTAIAVGTDGLPVISYNDNTNGTLKVVKCATRSCL